MLCKLETFGAVKNPYTNLTRALVSDMNTQLGTGLRARKVHFEEELERQLDDEQACEHFGETANPLLKHIATSMAQLMRPKVCRYIVHHLYASDSARNRLTIF